MCNEYLIFKLEFKFLGYVSTGVDHWLLGEDGTINLFTISRTK